jgi:hypothetical protein
MHMPNKWVGLDGKTRWFVFSGLHELDSFNVVKARFKTRGWLDWLHATSAQN